MTVRLLSFFCRNLFIHQAFPVFTLIDVALWARNGFVSKIDMVSEVECFGKNELFIHLVVYRFINSCH